MDAPLFRFLIVWPVAVTSLFIAQPAAADDNDPSVIELRLKQLEASPENKTIVAEACRNARQALKRVVDARTAGDATHAVELAALANDWAKVAADVLRSVELDRELKAQQTRLSELEQKRRRAEILLEATVAQRERTREELRRRKQEQPSTKKPSIPTRVLPPNQQPAIGTAKPVSKSGAHTGSAP
ncbi:MAG TPA: hypothetical protein VIV60_11210 [Polyangiaceae bacterium]